MTRRTSAILLGSALAAVLAAGSLLYGNLSSGYRPQAASSAVSSRLSSAEAASLAGMISSEAASLQRALPQSPAASSSAVSFSAGAASQPASKSAGAASKAASEPAQSVTNPAPNFTVYDASGKAVTLSSFHGTPVVLNFWASWCYYCKKEMPDFNEVYNKEKGSVQFLFVDWTDGYQETQKTASAFLKAQGYSFPAYFDMKQDAVAKYELTGIPATFYINRQGQLVAGGEGMTTKDALERGIALIK